MKTKALLISLGITSVALLCSCQEKGNNTNPLAIGHQELSPTIKVLKYSKIGKVSEYYQSFNLEMSEVIGGKFWKPYNALGKNNMDSSFEYRKPIHFKNEKLEKLTKALGPFLLRISGASANTVYFDDSEKGIGKNIPKGFSGVLTKKEWQGVVDFTNAVDAKIVTSFSTSPGTRDQSGLWRIDEAKKFLNFNKLIGGKISAVEFMNEPNIAEIGGTLKNYSAKQFGRDFKVFYPFIKEFDDKIEVIGPGVIDDYHMGEINNINKDKVIKTNELLSAEGVILDGVSYHFYGALSERCKSLGEKLQTSPEEALSNEWLSQTEGEANQVIYQRNLYFPEKHVWLTETADAACGGNSWAKSFSDTFRYVDQLGRLAQKGVYVVIHNTLASSDYGLLDEKTFEPRANYWAAVLWKKLMGRIVLFPNTDKSFDNFKFYAHCSPEMNGSVTYALINLDAEVTHSIYIPEESEKYELSADDLNTVSVRLNSKKLKLKEDDLPEMNGILMKRGVVEFRPETITFLKLKGRKLDECKE